MVKFKIGFTVSAETLFAMMAKMLPIDDLSVEEVIDRPPARPEAKVARQVRLAKIAPPKRKRRSRGVDLKQGVNAIVLGILSDGQPHRASELEEPVKADGYSPNSVGSRLQTLREHGIVFQPSLGLWQLASAKQRTVNE